MTEKVKSQWSSLSLKSRYLLVFVITVVLFAIPIIAFAGSGVTFSSPTPANGTKSSNPKPTISVKATTTEGTIEQKDISMKVGEDSVTPSFNSSTGIISYTPTDALEDKSYSVSVGVYDSSLGKSKDQIWNFIVDATPNAGGWQPTKGSTVTLTYPQVPEISLNVSDIADSLDTGSVTATINGTPTTAELKLMGRMDYDYDTGDPVWIVANDKVGTLTLKNPVLKDGTNDIVVSVADVKGNVLKESWSFNFVRVYGKPTVTEQTPFKYGVTDRTPTISATVKSDNGAIKADSIVLKVDGETVDHNYSSTTGKVSYTPSKALKNEDYHDVSLTVADSSGQLETKTWKFYITTYSEMSDSNISNCTSCHALTPIYDYKGDRVLNRPFEEVHAKKIGFDGNHSNNRCNNCHLSSNPKLPGYISKTADCVQCHEIDDAAYAPHGTTESIKYTAMNPQPGAVLRVTTNREMWDCVICHQPGAGTKGYVGYEAVPSRLLNNHDIPGLHKTTTYTDGGDCNDCHALSMTREHAREGRVDQEGKDITCNTCHKSTDAKVKDAIANNKKDCASCHTNADHEEFHTYKGLNSSCTSCHDNVLTKEHNKIEGFSCDDCHDSVANPDYSTDFKQSVNTAITWNQLSCTECHSGLSKHGVTLEKTVPKDLQYESLDWMSPESIDFWVGESWVPNDMAGGLYTITKRKAGLSGTDVFNYYKNKMTELGWAKSSGPDAGGNKFELVYTKGTAKTIIRFYNTEDYTNNTDLGKGHRIEILYK